MTAENLKKLKKTAGIVLLALMAAFLVCVNVSEIRKGGATIRTVAGSTFRNVTYFNDFTLETFDGGTFSNKDFEGYDIVVANVWEPYCSSCLKEMPELDELAKEYDPKGLKIIGIQGTAFQYPEDVELGYSSIEELGVSIPMLLADEKFTDEVLPYLNDSFPGTWILDSQGNIIDFAAGAKSKEAWKEYFDSFLD